MVLGQAEVGQVYSALPGTEDMSSRGAHPARHTGSCLGQWVLFAELCQVLYSPGVSRINYVTPR